MVAVFCYMPSSVQLQFVKFFSKLEERKLLIGSEKIFNPLNAELNPICHLLALLEAQHILRISRIRVIYHAS